MALSIGLLIPTALAAQSERSAEEYRVARTEAGSHADHADLHRPSAADAGVALLAAETLGIDNTTPALCRAAKLALTMGLLTGWERAETSLREALDVEPDNPMHRIELALLLHDTGRTDAARDQLRRVLANPDASPLVAYYKEQARGALRRLE